MHLVYQSHKAIHKATTITRTITRMIQTIFCGHVHCWLVPVLHQLPSLVMLCHNVHLVTSSSIIVMHWRHFLFQQVSHQLIKQRVQHGCFVSTRSSLALCYWHELLLQSSSFGSLRGYCNSLDSFLHHINILMHLVDHVCELHGHLGGISKRVCNI